MKQISSTPLILALIFSLILLATAAAGIAISDTVPIVPIQIINNQLTKSQSHLPPPVQPRQEPASNAGSPYNYPNTPNAAIPTIGQAEDSAVRSPGAIAGFVVAGLGMLALGCAIVWYAFLVPRSIDRVNAEGERVRREMAKRNAQ